MIEIQANIWKANPKRCLPVVSIGVFLSISNSFLYKGNYYSIFSCFPFYSSYVIVVHKNPYEDESNHSVGGGLFHWRALLTFYTAPHQKVSFIEWLRWLIFKLDWGLWRKHTSLYEKEWKKTKNAPMETTLALCRK